MIRFPTRGIPAFNHNKQRYDKRHTSLDKDVIKGIPAQTKILQKVYQPRQRYDKRHTSPPIMPDKRCTNHMIPRGCKNSIKCNSGLQTTRQSNTFKIPIRRKANPLEGAKLNSERRTPNLSKILL